MNRIRTVLVGNKRLAHTIPPIHMLRNKRTHANAKSVWDWNIEKGGVLMDSDEDDPISIHKPHGKYIGIIYKAVFCPPISHSLTGCTYFGQSIKLETMPNEVFRIRKRDHIATSKRVYSCIGFHALIRQYGKSAFEWSLLEHIYGDRDDVQAWADEREKEHIRINGGPLRSTTRCNQTLNLTHGGQHNTRWISNDVLAALAWDDFLRHLITFKEEHGHCVVPQKYKSSDGFTLGTSVSMVRSGRSFVKGFPERQATLKSLGFVFDMRKFQWDHFYNELINYKKEFGHVDVPGKWITPDGMQLGRMVSKVRNDKTYLRKSNAHERFKMLQRLGFEWRSPRAQKPNRTNPVPHFEQ